MFNVHVIDMRPVATGEANQANVLGPKLKGGPQKWLIILASNTDCSQDRGVGPPCPVCLIRYLYISVVHFCYYILHDIILIIWEPPPKNSTLIPQRLLSVIHFCAHILIAHLFLSLCVGIIIVLTFLWFWEKTHRPIAYSSSCDRYPDEFG